MFKQLLTSKKFVACAIGMVAIVASILLNKIHVDIPDDKIAEFVGVLVAYIVGQGIADNGKEAAKVAADSPVDPVPNVPVVVK